ncbi:MAG: hypothetical protein RLZZ272_1118 [Actinomycetota bacterium]
MSASGSSVRIHGIGRTFRTSTGEHAAVIDLDLDVAAGSFTTILGASGCGKTTTLRMIAGLERPDSGVITLGDRTVFSAESGVDVPPHRRGVGMVFQTFAVWPHLSVLDNVAYPLRTAGQGRRDARVEAASMLEQVGLGGLGRRRTSQLSGGQQQRVAIARALVHRPRVLLLDEPFSSLDGPLRAQLGQELRVLQRELGITIVYVTHDRREALLLSDRVAVLADGRLVQVGGPRELYDRPTNRLVAETLGATNLFEVLGPLSTEAGGIVHVPTRVGRLRAVPAPSGGPGPTGPLLVNVRVEAITLAPTGSGLDPESANVLHGRVVRTVYRGPNSDVDVAVGDGTVRVRTSLQPEPCPGDEVVLTFPVERATVIGGDPAS